MALWPQPLRRPGERTREAEVAPWLAAQSASQPQPEPRILLVALS
jgi:hypothetical protein